MRLLKKSGRIDAVRKTVKDVVKKDIVNHRLHSAATAGREELWQLFHTSPEGLDGPAVSASRREYGENRIAKEKRLSLALRITKAFLDPFSVILLGLAGVSAVTDIILPLYQNNRQAFNPVTVIIIMTIILFSGVLRFFQESRSDEAARKLMAMITTTCSIKRKGAAPAEFPMEEVVTGDILLLSAGDMIPADVRILESKDLFIAQSSLTGESEPQEKTALPVTGNKEALTDYPNLAFMGSNVISGTAKAVAVATGNDTLLGSMAKVLEEAPVETSFSKGINSVSWMLIRFMAVMVPIVFFLNGMTKGNWLEALLFSISVAVGLTPEMLPMIVTTTLAKGAVSMSKKQVIVKQLNSIQNFGAMDILCTDKTGTLTEDRVVLEYHLNIEGKESSRVLRHAYLNSYFQTGYKNLMDLAIIACTEEAEHRDKSLTDLSEYYHKVDEIPFDFTRRRLSVVVEDQTGKHQMITKGAVEEMLSICSFADMEGSTVELTKERKSGILKQVEKLNQEGMRVIALAQKTNPSLVGSFSVMDEHEMVLIGYLAFLDPPKESSKAAIKALWDHGVSTKVLTGDNDKVTRYVCEKVGLLTDHLLLGSDIESMGDEELKAAAERTTVFAKLSPNQKARVVSLLRENGHTVGYMGDGINDAAAMKKADIGISVDTAVDIAKESADFILMEKSLMVLEEGILEGRRTYANMIKYIKMTASSNFGNVFSILAASALLPFLPMMSVHLILLNLIYDVSCSAIPWDHVDSEFLAKPSRWNASAIGKFMLFLGPVSSLFDWLTFFVMYFVICPMTVSDGVLYHQLAQGAAVAEGMWKGLDAREAYISLFQAGWFVESMWSQTLVIHMIRTAKIPFIQSRASLPVTVCTALGICCLSVIPFTALGRLLGFLPLPPVYFVYLTGAILAYMVLATIVKRVYIRLCGELL